MKKYGRILFYDARDGTVILDTGEMEGDVMKPNPEDYYRILEDTFGNKENIKHLQLEFGQHREEFNSHSHFRILNDDKVWFSQKDSKYNLGAKSTMNDRHWPFFEDLYELYDKDRGIFNEDRIHKFYNDYIGFNLKNACMVAKPLWLGIGDMERFDSSIDEFIPLWGNGVFPSLDEFASEILDNGFTFPMHVTPRGGKYAIYDGQHRIVACNHLKNIGLWPEDRKLLCISMDAINVKFVDSPHINYDLGRNITMHIPTKLMDKYSFIDCVSSREYDEDITEVEVHRYLDTMILARLYVNETTRIRNRYYKETKTTLTNPVINDPDAFSRWIND